MNLAKVEEATRVLLAANQRLMQIHRFAENDSEHVGRLLWWAMLPPGANVVDLGAGVGEMARLAKTFRPDLRWTLVNLSEYQLAFAPETAQKCVADFRATKLPRHSFDAAMHCFSLGHEDYAPGLQEAAALLKPGGILFVYDMTREAGTSAGMRAVDYHVEPVGELEKAASEWFELDFKLLPTPLAGVGENLLGSEAFEEIFGGCVPTIWRFLRK